MQDVLRSLFRSGELYFLARTHPYACFTLFDRAIKHALRHSNSTRRHALKQFQARLTIKLLWSSRTVEQRMAIARAQRALLEKQHFCVLDAFITLARNQRRAKQTQWCIDTRVAQHTTALGACIEVSSMMCASMWGPGGLNEQLNQFLAFAKTSSGTKPSCKVLQFQSNKKTAG